MQEQRYQELEQIAKELRLSVLEQTYNAKSGHPGGALSMAEIMAYLFFKELNIDPANPKWAARDRFVLSKGHSAPILYAALAFRGFFDKAELKNLRKYGHFLQGHPDMKKIPGVDMSSGSLGQGISAACGMALMSGKPHTGDYNVYTVLGDGELDEGQVWEAAAFASRYQLKNLCAFIDNNGLQLCGPIGKLSIGERFRAFGWNVVEIDGHDFEQIAAALDSFHKADMPTAVICKTVKGKGVSFMEHVVGWHGVAPNEQQYKAAVAELN